MGCGCGLLVIGAVVFFAVRAISNRVAGVMPDLSKDLNSLRELKEMKDSGQLGPHKQETYALKSDARHFDPFAAIDDIKTHVGTGARLYSVEADYVASDGTMNLYATYDPQPEVKYKFYFQQDHGPKEAPPIGAGRGPKDVWLQSVEVTCYEPGKEMHVVLPNGRHNSSYFYKNEGMDFSRSSTYMGKLDPDLGAPNLTPAQMWKTAVARGAPKDAVAKITYNMNGYHFSIEGTDFDLYWDSAGKLKQ